MRRSGGNWSASDFEEPSHHAKSGRQDSRPQVWACANQLRWKHCRGASEADESIPRPGMVLSSHPSPRRELRTSPSGQPFQVQGQEGYANLRGMFPGKVYVGCDMRPGPGVDRVEDVSAINLPDASAGTVLCIETFEHVFEVRRAFDEVFRILEPGGIFVITTPLNFRIHGYPDDYWRLTPNCLRRLMAPYAARVAGSQGHPSFPHSVMAVGIKTPAPVDIAVRAAKLVATYHEWLRQARSSLPVGVKLRRALGQVYRSKGERSQIANYYTADFSIDIDDRLAQAG
ncbi:MAG: methyltransferase domain-containing protein [Isosphaeraceae bacterium]